MLTSTPADSTASRYASGNDNDIARKHFMNHTTFTAQLDFCRPAINPVARYSAPWEPVQINPWSRVV